MPIVVKHEPSAAAVLGMSRIAGEGAFNKWKTEFEARQKQYAFQNLMSGISGGMGLAQPFIQSAQQQAGRDHQLAMYEKAQGDKQLQDQKDIKGSAAILNNLFRVDGPYGARPDGSPWFSQNEINDIVQNPTARRALVQQGLGAATADQQARYITNPDNIQRQVRARTTMQEAQQAARIGQLEALQNKLVADPNLGFQWDSNQKDIYSNDPASTKRYQDLAGRIKRIKLGQPEQTFQQKIPAMTEKIPGTNSFWVDDGKGGLELKHANPIDEKQQTLELPRGDAQGRATFNPKQKLKWKGMLDDHLKVIRENNKPDERLMTSFLSQQNKLQTQVDNAHLTINSASATAEEKAAAQGQLQSAETRLQTHNANPPTGRMGYEEMYYMAEERTVRDTELLPYYNQKWKQRDFGYPEQPRSWLDEALAPQDARINRHLRGLGPGATYRDAAGLLQQRFPNQSSEQILNALQPSYERHLERQAAEEEAAEAEGRRQRGEPPLPPRETWRERAGQQYNRMMNRPGTRGMGGPAGGPAGGGPAGGGPAGGSLDLWGQPIGGPAGGGPAGGGRAQGQPAEAKPWQASWLQESRIAGPHVAREAFGTLTAEHEREFGTESPLGREIFRVLGDPAKVEKINQWLVHGGGEYGGPFAKPGRLKDNRELLKDVYSALQEEERALAVRTETGARPQAGRGTDPGQPPLRSQVEEGIKTGGRAKKVREIFDKRREMVAGVIEATVKWSRKADPNGPVNPANIPSPNREEFIGLVESGQVKAGDVLVVPPETLQGVQISGSGFVVVTQKAIDDRHKSPEQIQQGMAEEAREAAFEASLDPRTKQLRNWDTRLDEVYGGANLSPAKTRSRAKYIRRYRKVAEELNAAMLRKASLGELSPPERRSWDIAKEFLKKFPLEK